MVNQFYAQYFIYGIEDEAGAKRVEELTAEGITAEYYGFDVTKDEQVTENIQKIGEKYGRIDALFTDTSILPYFSFKKLEKDMAGLMC